MKKVSCKMFFTVLWRGICQALGWFFGLFGYKKNGKFAKCVWGIFAVSATILMALMSSIALYCTYDFFSWEHKRSHYYDSDNEMYISSNIRYIASNKSDGYLINKKTGKKVLKGIEWIARPTGKDSLVCFSNGKLRGYFNAKDGKVIIEPKYNHAWIFSDGLAAVEEDNKIKFIDGTGKVVINRDLAYRENVNNYVFHGGYLAIKSNDHNKWGLMDTTGALVLPIEFDRIKVANNMQYWCISKDDQQAVYDKNLNVVLPFMDGQIFCGINYINVTMADHTLRKYDYEGNLVNDFYIVLTNPLEYVTDEIYYTKGKYKDEDYDEHECLVEEHKKATARLRSYLAGDGYEGLMTAEGHIITMPLYQEIEAIGPDTYLCTVSNGDKIIVDGKGEIVR